MTKISNFENSRWRTAAILKIDTDYVTKILRQSTFEPHLNRDNKTANINVKTVVYLQLITAK